MDDEEVLEGLDLDGDGGIAGGGHILDLGLEGIGGFDAGDIAVIVDSDEEAASGSIGEGDHFPREVAVCVFLELYGISCSSESVIERQRYWPVRVSRQSRDGRILACSASRVVASGSEPQRAASVDRAKPGLLRKASSLPDPSAK